MRTSGSSLRIRGQRRGGPPTPWQHDRQQHRRWGRSALRLGVALGVVAAAIATVAHHRGELTSADRLLGHLNWWWLTAAVTIEGASLMACARLRRRLLDAGGIGIGLGTAVAITLASNALSVTLPADVAGRPGSGPTQLARRLRLPGHGVSGDRIAGAMAWPASRLRDNLLARNDSDHPGRARCGRRDPSVPPGHPRHSPSPGGGGRPAVSAGQLLGLAPAGLGRVRLAPLRIQENQWPPSRGQTTTRASRPSRVPAEQQAPK